MTALDIAAAHGIPLRQKGTRYWACCPLHGEKTASMCFFPDGRWYCFGCHRHGDAADLYAALRSVSLAEALQAVKGTIRRTTSAADLRRRVEAWKSKQWAEACKQKHRAYAAFAALEAQHTPEVLSKMQIAWEVLRQAAEAEDLLNLLERATPAQLLHLMAKET